MTTKHQLFPQSQAMHVILLNNSHRTG